MAIRMLKIYLSVTRSYAPVLMCIGALVGMLISKGLNLSIGEAITPLAALYFLTAASFLFNDIFDLEVDKLNRINRPLATGELSVKSAWILWVILTATGLALSLFIQYREATIILVFSYLLSLLYTLKIKSHGLLGNIVVAALVSLTLIYGSVSVVGSFPSSMISLVVLALLLNLAREVIQGIADAPGDAAREVKSIARQYGTRVAKALGAFLIALMITSAPFTIRATGAEFFRNLSILYGYILITVGFIYVIYLLWRAEDERDVRKVLSLINALTIALIALIIISVVL